MIMTRRAQRVSDIISYLEMSEYEFACRYGISRSTLNSWKNEGVDPGDEMIQKLCEAMGITLDEFYRGIYNKESMEEREALVLKILSRGVIKAFRAGEAAEVMRYLIRTSDLIAS